MEWKVGEESGLPGRVFRRRQTTGVLSQDAPWWDWEVGT